MNTLIGLSVDGTLAFLFVMLLERRYAPSVCASVRRLWWLVIPSVFLVPVHFHLLPALPALPSSLIPSLPPDIPPVPLGEALEGVAPASTGLSPLLFGFYLLWGAGFSIALGTLLTSAIRSCRRWRSERLSTDSRLLSILEDCKLLAEVRTPIGLVVSEHIASPSLIGWRHPRLLIPRHLAASMPDDQLKAIFLHELAHISNLDIPMRWLFLIASALHWYNPVAWLALRQWLRFQEEGADEQALLWMAADSSPDADDPPEQTYLEALLSSLRHAKRAPTLFNAALSMTAITTKSRLANIRQSRGKTSRPFLVFTIAILLVSALSLRPTFASEVSPSASESDPSKKEATAAMLLWLNTIDAGRYSQSWDDASAYFKGALTREHWVTALQTVRTPLGKLKERNVASALHQQGVPARDGTITKVDSVIVQFTTSFENLASALETVTFDRESDGKWRASGYYVKPE